MKRIKIISFLALSMLLSISSLFGVAAQSSVFSIQHTEKIKSNCVSVKNTLIQLHSSDALLRVNRGQIYESISTKLMDGFNGRVKNNGHDNSNFVSISKNYNRTLDAFRLDYIKYEENLSMAINIDCSSQPTQFYDAILVARESRNQVNADISSLNQYINQYKLAIEKFEKDHQSNSGDKK